MRNVTLIYNAITNGRKTEAINLIKDSDVLLNDFDSCEVMNMAVYSGSMWLVHDLLDLGIKTDGHHLFCALRDGHLGVYNVIAHAKKLSPICSHDHATGVMSWLDGGMYDPRIFREIMDGYDMTEVYNYCRQTNRHREAADQILREGCYDLK